ncbi:TVP38/TMEM64 family protein [Gemmatimonas sp.]|uniref:TVP38/TMEM64 family protein n=1 Tax=Gemmatimonas sp. TaxID=1962908 RepID=UPI002ED8CCE6
MATSFREPKALLQAMVRIVGMAIPIVFGVTVGKLATPYLPGFSAWVHTLGPWAPVAFVGAYVAVVVCMLPAFLLTMAGGAVFGIAQGASLVLIGATIGGSIAFLLGRTVLRTWVTKRIAQNPTLSTIDRVVGQDGLKLMFLLRLSPAIPFVLSNYALGATSVRLRDFVFAMVGMLPVIGAYAALGHAGTRGANEQSLPPWVLGVGIAATVLLGVLLARITQQALRDADRGADRGADRTSPRDESNVVAP